MKPRDSYQDQELALNTFKRDGTFSRIQEDWGTSWITYHDNYDGCWRKNDWMGQTAGVPIRGKMQGSDAITPIRENYLQWMLSQVVDENLSVVSYKSGITVPTEKIEYTDFYALRDLVKQGEGYDAAIQAATKGIESSYDVIQKHALVLFEALVKQGQSYGAAIQARLLELGDL